MIKAIKEAEIIITEEQQELMYWEELKFNSHKWVETHKGYYKCSFCGTSHTSAMPMNGKTLCKDNIFLYGKQNWFQHKM
jgi:hypothetical protein